MKCDLRYGGWKLCRSVCVWIYDGKGRLSGSSRKKKKGAFPHSDCTRLFITVTHTGLTSVKLLLDNFIVMPIFSGSFKT